jgi:hypothetical protein
MHTACRCVVAVAPSARKKALGEVFSLGELQLRTTTECGYLEEDGGGSEGLGRLRHLALFHSADAASGRCAACSRLCHNTVFVAQTVLLKWIKSP